MAAAETVAWVKPPEPIRGLDHLGVQAPCIALYDQLLPGITCVFRPDSIAVPTAFDQDSEIIRSGFRSIRSLIPTIRSAFRSIRSSRPNG